MNKKMIAPCVIAVLMSLYYLALFAGFFIESPNYVVVGICGVLLLGSIGVMIYVTLERLKEIRSGEEDDLSKY